MQRRSSISGYCSDRWSDCSAWHPRHREPVTVRTPMATTRQPPAMAPTTLFRRRPPPRHTPPSGLRLSIPPRPTPGSTSLPPPNQTHQRMRTTTSQSRADGELTPSLDKASRHGSGQHRGSSGCDRATTIRRTDADRGELADAAGVTGWRAIIVGERCRRALRRTRGLLSRQQHQSAADTRRIHPAGAVLTTRNHDSKAWHCGGFRFSVLCWCGRLRSLPGSVGCRSPRSASSAVRARGSRKAPTNQPRKPPRPTPRNTGHPDRSPRHTNLGHLGSGGVIWFLAGPTFTGRGKDVQPDRRQTAGTARRRCAGSPDLEDPVCSQVRRAPRWEQTAPTANGAAQRTTSQRSNKRSRTCQTPNRPALVTQRHPRSTT